MNAPYTLRESLTRLGMHIPVVDFDSVSAFVCGFDLATGGGALEGFHEWLVVKLGRGNNSAFTELVLELAFPEAESPRDQLRTGAGDKRATDLLLAFLEEF